jgi:ribonuclease HI
VSPDFVIFVDGGCSANPGNIAVAAVACSPEGQVLVESARLAGHGTNNIAEYKALRHGIELANLVEVVVEQAVRAGEGTNNVAEYRALSFAVCMANLVGARRPLFLSDSMLVVQQVNGYWALRSSADLAAQHNHCTAALMRFERWTLQHIPREKNKRADWLACAALGHKRTLKKAPDVSRVECEREGRPGWAALTA